MNKTKSILLQLNESIRTGSLIPDEQIIDDICDCFYREIELALVLFSDERKAELVDEANLLISKTKSVHQDTKAIVSNIESMIFCIDLVSEAKSWFVNKQYWEKMHHHDIAEVREIIDYIEVFGEIDAISSIFVCEYNDFQIDVSFDELSGLRFVLHNGKRMYFPRNYDVETIQNYYKGIVIEQDERSPHYYYKEGYAVKPGDIVVDAGVAEGNFSLDIVDIADHIYLIEADELWIEALQHTFKDYADKVTIIKGYLSADDEGENVSIDTLFDNKSINYIKMDIEGFERFALIGAENTISNSQDFRCAICSYHKQGDEQWIEEYLSGMFMDVATSDGYMVPVWDYSAYHDAEVRRGVVFGRK